MKEMNDFLLNLFTSSDELRPQMMFPNLENGIVTATDSHALIMIPENEVCLKYGTNPKYPKAEKLVKEFEARDLTSVKVRMQDLAKEISKARLEVDKDSIKCKECGGDGYVDFKYTDKSGYTHSLDGDCPICEGEGIDFINPKFARIRLVQRQDDNGNNCDIVIDDLHFHPFQIYRLFMVALVKGYDEIEIFYDKNKYGQAIAYIGNIKVLIMVLSKK